MDSSDFERYYNEFRDKIYSYLYYRCGRNKALAEDLTSEVFMKALEKFHTYKRDKSFKSWIFTIAHNHLVDHYRSSRTTVDLDRLENLIVSDGDVKSTLMKRIAAEQVRELLKHVNDEEREILLMRYHIELPMKDIADIVDRSEGNVRVIIHRALAKLQKQYSITFACLSMAYILAFLTHFFPL